MQIINLYDKINNFVFSYLENKNKTSFAIHALVNKKGYSIFFDIGERLENTGIEKDIAKEQNIEFLEKYISELSTKGRNNQVLSFYLDEEYSCRIYVYSKKMETLHFKTGHKEKLLSIINIAKEISISDLTHKTRELTAKQRVSILNDLVNEGRCLLMLDTSKGRKKKVYKAMV